MTTAEPTRTTETKTSSISSRAFMNYPTISNCNYNDSQDADLHASHLARKAVEAGYEYKPLVNALDALEETLTDELSESGEFARGVLSSEAIEEAEAVVRTAYAEIPPKSTVENDWDTVAAYVVTYPIANGRGASDGEVQIGRAVASTSGHYRSYVPEHWYLRTRDDAGGSDEGGDEAYTSRDEAERAAKALAESLHEGEEGEDAEAYLARRLTERAGEPTADGEWCVYWDTSLEDSGPRERYATQDQAEAAAEIAQAKFEAANPASGGTTYLCGYEPRQLVDGEWLRVAE